VDSKGNPGQDSPLTIGMVNVGRSEQHRRIRRFGHDGRKMARNRRTPNAVSMPLSGVPLAVGLRFAVGGGRIGPQAGFRAMGAGPRR